MYLQALPQQSKLVHPVNRNFGRIVGGEEVTPHSVPNQVALSITSGFQSFFCGGSIIGMFCELKWGARRMPRKDADISSEITNTNIIFTPQLTTLSSLLPIAWTLLTLLRSLLELMTGLHLSQSNRSGFPLTSGSTKTGQHLPLTMISP